MSTKKLQQSDRNNRQIIYSSNNNVKKITLQLYNILSILAGSMTSPVPRVPGCASESDNNRRGPIRDMIAIINELLSSTQHSTTLLDKWLLQLLSSRHHQHTYSPLPPLQKQWRHTARSTAIGCCWRSWRHQCLLQLVVGDQMITWHDLAQNQPTRACTYCLLHT